MKFSTARQHNKVNSNCLRLFEEYKEMVRASNEHRATTLRRRICQRYGREVFESLLNPENSEELQQC